MVYWISEKDKRSDRDRKRDENRYDTNSICKKCETIVENTQKLNKTGPIAQPPKRSTLITYTKTYRTNRETFHKTFIIRFVLFFVLLVRGSCTNEFWCVKVLNGTMYFSQCLCFVLVHSMRIFSVENASHITHTHSQPVVCMHVVCHRRNTAIHKRKRTEWGSPTNMLILQYFFSFFLPFATIFYLRSGGGRVARQI